MSGSSQEALLEVRQWSGGPPGSSGVVGRLSRMSGRVLEWSGVPLKCPGVDGRPSRMSWSVREWSGGPS